MRKFQEFITEEILPFAQTEKGFVGIDNGPVRDNINLLLANVTNMPFATPYSAMEAVRRVLITYHIALPSTNFMDGEVGHEIFPINQFGKKLGELPTGDVVTQMDSAYYVYFEYEMNDRGSFDIFCEVVDEDELNDILDDVEEEDSEIEYDAEDSYDAYKAGNMKEETISEISKQLASKAAEKAYDAGHKYYDSTTKLRGKAIKSKDRKDLDAANAEQGKMSKKWKQSMKFKAYADKKMEEDYDFRAKQDAEDSAAIAKRARKPSEKKFWKKANRENSKKAVTGIDEESINEVSFKLAHRAMKAAEDKGRDHDSKSYKAHLKSVNDKRLSDKGKAKAKADDIAHKEASKKKWDQASKFRDYARKKLDEVSKATAERAYAKARDKGQLYDKIAGLTRHKMFDNGTSKDWQKSANKKWDQARKFADYSHKKSIKEETKQLEFRPTNVPEKDKGPFTKNLKFVKKADCSKEKLDEVSAALAQRASDAAQAKASKLGSKYMQLTSAARTSNKTKRERGRIGGQEMKAIKQHIKFSDYAAKKSIKEDAPFDNPTEKPSTPYKKPGNKAKQLARAAMKKAMTSDKAFSKLSTKDQTEVNRRLRMQK